MWKKTLSKSRPNARIRGLGIKMSNKQGVNQWRGPIMCSCGHAKYDHSSYKNSCQDWLCRCTKFNQVNIILQVP